MGACFSTNFVSRPSSCTSFCVWEREQTTAARERRSARVGLPFLLALMHSRCRGYYEACNLGVEVTILSTHEQPLTSPMARRRRGWPVKPSAPQHIESLEQVLQQRTPHIPSRQRRCMHARQFSHFPGHPGLRTCNTHPYSSSAASKLDRFSLARLIRMYPWCTHCQHTVRGTSAGKEHWADSLTTDLHGERLPEQL
jgi:hypothetical protein